MNFLDFKYKANYYAILLLAFVIPLERKLTPPLIILFLVTSIINSNTRTKKNIGILLFGLLFVFYLLGIFQSSSFNTGISNVVEKLSLLIFPLAIYLSNIDFKNKLKYIFLSFIDGCATSVLVSLIVALFTFFFKGDTSLFFYGNISYFLHTSYFAMYLSFAIFILYYNLKNKSFLNPIISTVLITLFSIFIILSTSKTGLISLISIHLFWLSYYIIKHKAYLKGSVAILIIALGSLFAYSSSSVLQERINELTKVIGTSNTSDGSSTATRVEIWKISTKLISEKPILGYGTGNEKEILTQEYKNHGLTDCAEKQLNAHNQFLQTTIALGLIGGLCLLLMLILPLILTLKMNHYIYTFFILLIGLNFMTESILERQSGVVFYAFFNSLLYFTFVNNDNKKPI